MNYSTMAHYSTLNRSSVFHLFFLHQIFFKGILYNHHFTLKLEGSSAPAVVSKDLTNLGKLTNNGLGHGTAKKNKMYVYIYIYAYFKTYYIYTLQGTNISHLGKAGKSSTQKCL